MTHGARESNSKEGMGLMILILGIAVLSAGWAYGPPLLGILFGLAGIGAGFAVLKAAKDAA